MGEGAKTVVLSFKTKWSKWEGGIDLEPVLSGYSTKKNYGHN